MARTGVLVSRHGPLLANTMFLPPGAGAQDDALWHQLWHMLACLQVPGATVYAGTKMQKSLSLTSSGCLRMYKAWPEQVFVTGAVVLELLPYNWDWKGISEIYVNLTRSLGDVHHLAWRARHPRWAQYNNIDEQRYADWTAEECSSR